MKHRSDDLSVHIKFSSKDLWELFKDHWRAKECLKKYADGLKDSGKAAKEILKSFRCDWVRFEKDEKGYLYDSLEHMQQQVRENKNADSGDSVQRSGGDKGTGGKTLCDGGGKDVSDSGSPDQAGSAQGSGAVLDLGASLQRVWTEPRTVQEAGDSVQIPNDPHREKDSIGQAE
jgi:hypothetical protein